MPRKSKRTASTTYRRRRLTWDDTESLALNNSDDDDQPKGSKLPIAVKAGSGRLVTPSPQGVSPLNRLGKDKSAQKRPPRRKRLFAKKTLKKKSTLTKGRTKRQLSLTSDKGKETRPSKTDGVGGSSSAENLIVSETKGYKRVASRKRSLHVGSKDIALKQNPTKRNISSGDSLATFLSFKNTVKSSKGSSMAKSNRRSNLSNLRSSSLQNKNKPTTEDRDSELVEKNCIASDDREIPNEKEKRPISPELIPLLTSRTRRKTRRTKARSTLEILNEFKKNRKQLQSQRCRRTRLPRSCKSSKESVWKEDTEEEEDESKTNVDDDSDWTASNISVEKNLQGSEEDPTKKITVTDGSCIIDSSTDTEVSLPAITLNPRTRPSQTPARNKNSEVDSNRRVLRKRQRSTSEKSDTLRQAKNAKKVSQRKSNFSRSATRRTNSDSRTKKDTMEMGGRRRRLRKDSNVLDASNSGVSGRNAVGSTRLSPRKDSQQSQKRYSTSLNKSRGRQTTNQFESDFANSSTRAITIQGSHEESIDASSKNLSNMKFSKRASQQQQRPQFYSKSPTQLVSLLNGESRAHESPISAKRQSRSSPQRKKEQRLQQHSKADNEVLTSNKKVRFDSSTTTFSVKIKIKTNLDARNQDKKKSQNGKSGPFAPALDESAVQAIANQVTQACLTQARTSTGTRSAGVTKTGDDSVVNVDVDMHGDDDSSSNSSSKSNESIVAKEELGNSNRGQNFSHSIFGRKIPSVPDSKPKQSYQLRHDFDDCSELTSDWNRPRSSVLNRHTQLGLRRQQQIQPFGRDNVTKKNHFVENSHNNIMRPPRSIPMSHRFGETRSHSSLSRRQRMRSSGDSLAGSGFGSITSALEAPNTNRIPREVSLRKSPSRSTGRKSPRRKPTVDNDTNQNMIPAKRIDSEDQGIRVIPSATATNSSNNSRIVPFSSSHRCGKCKGCRRTFDCQTCDACIEKLHSYGSLRPPSANKGPTLCLERRCQRACRIGFVDSLLGSTKSMVNPQRQPADHREREHAMSTTDTPRFGYSVIPPMATKNQDVPDSALKNMKAPWEEGDDWTVDYSYLSEPEYRRHWGIVSNSNEQIKPLSSSKSLSAPSWRPSVGKKQAIGLFGSSGGRTTSLSSSVSESALSSQNRFKKTNPTMPMPNNPAKGGRRKSRKQKRDPLHGIALPRTSTDASSVTSWRENRKCLRALMEYDEADQDWV